MSKYLTRRELLRATAVGAAGLALAACQPKVVEKVVKETVLVEKEVEKVVKETVIVAGTPKVVEKVVKETVVVEKEAPSPAPARPVDLDFWYIWGGQGGEAMEAVSAEFEKRNPEVTMHPLPLGGAILDKTIAAFAAATSWI